MSTSGSTKTAGLIGHPVGHTMSPMIHSALAEYTGQNVVYAPFLVEPGTLQKAVEGADALGFLGLNVTVPYKTDVIPFLNGLDGLAEKIGAVNTLVREEGKSGFTGYNTDLMGLYRALVSEGFELEGARVLILGAGGAARAAAFLCADKGAAEVVLFNRTVSKAEEIAQEIREKTGKSEVVAWNIQEYEAFFRDQETKGITGPYLCLQCTSVGLHPNADAAAIEDPTFYAHLSGGFDLVYRPMTTKFMKLCRAAGAKAACGLKMLLYQAIISWQLWTQTEVSDETADRIYRMLARELSTTKNIVLVGFMGCGKSSISTVLSEKLGYTAVDTDVLIEEESGRTIPEIFAEDGEAAFRQMETTLLRRIAESGEDRHVYATGGGMALSEENRRLLQEIGTVFYLTATPETVYERTRGDAHRPLLQTENPLERIRELQAQREVYYDMAADERIETDGRLPQELAEEILKKGGFEG